MNRRRFQAGYLILALAVIAAFFVFRPSQIFQRSPPSWNSSNPLAAIGSAAPVPPPPISPAPKKLMMPPPRRGKTLAPAAIEELRANAKISLAANYSAQKSFFSEYHRYTTDLEAVGWFPEGFPLAYKSGFLNPFYPAVLAPNEDPRRLDTDALFDERRRDQGPLYTAGAESISLSGLSSFCKQGCTATDYSFEMLVAFNLDEDSTLEVWRITDKKELEQVVDDLKN